MTSSYVPFKLWVKWTRISTFDDLVSPYRRSIQFHTGIRSSSQFQPIFTQPQLLHHLSLARIRQTSPGSPQFLTQTTSNSSPLTSPKLNQTSPQFNFTPSYFFFSFKLMPSGAIWLLPETHTNRQGGLGPLSSYPLIYLSRCLEGSIAFFLSLRGLNHSTIKLFWSMSYSCSYLYAEFNTVFRFPIGRQDFLLSSWSLYLYVAVNRDGAYR
jgi:hypothetical protein